ncbi:RING/U-box superfamily protein [Raphanus sativus]|uniref:RING-type E3 ubiquitin transferase n=1 Tax=Raphanus sativus TaxID=3726 RepID=A0A6J0LDI0_RAPSA|nr:RING-H2 finger protein ATL52-like [Raphanus sativus]KAJ4902195.1 RING/U-box superfamily protein [Raphanus sativus]
MDGIVSTTRTVNYESKTHAVIDSQISGSFSILIRQVERSFVRLNSIRCENLLSQKTLPASAAIVFEIPPSFLLAGEEICSGYVCNALSKTIIDSWIQGLILPQICKEAIELSKTGHGFLVEAQVEAVKETYINDVVDLNDYDSKGQRIPIKPVCPICLKEFVHSTSTIITKLRCCNHCFHRDCILTWLRRNHSCPTCRDDIHNPRPKKHISKTVCLGQKPMAIKYSEA